MAEHAYNRKEARLQSALVSAHTSAGIPLQDDGGRIAGFVLERQGVQYIDKRIDEARHLHRKLNGYGIGDKPLRQAQDLGARYARFHDPQRGTVYLADLDLFRTNGKAVQYPGQSLQWILPLRYWTQAGGDNEPMFVAPVHQRPEAEQLGLFEVGAD
jgi:hypothetical protein